MVYLLSSGLREYWFVQFACIIFEWLMRFDPEYEFHNCFQIVNFALASANNEYAFYDDIEDLSDEPHLNQLTFIEDIQTTSEVYSLHSFGIHNASFTRVPMSSSKTPINEVIDQLLNAVKVGHYKCFKYFLIQ